MKMRILGKIIWIGISLSLILMNYKSLSVSIRNYKTKGITEGIKYTALSAVILLGVSLYVILTPYKYHTGLLSTLERIENCIYAVALTQILNNLATIFHVYLSFIIKSNNIMANTRYFSCICHLFLPCFFTI